MENHATFLKRLRFGLRPYRTTVSGVFGADEYSFLLLTVRIFGFSRAQTAATVYNVQKRKKVEAMLIGGHGEDESLPVRNTHSERKERRGC